MKILVLANTRMWGGAEIFLWTMCAEFCAKNIDTVVVCPPGSPAYSRFCRLPLRACFEEEMGVPSGRFRGMGSIALTLPNRSRFRELLRRVRQKYGCDLLVCQYPREQAVSSLAGEIGYKIAWIIHSQHIFFLQRLFLHSRLKRAMNCANKVFVVSQGTKDAFVSLGYPSEKMTVIPSGIAHNAHCLPSSNNTRFQLGVVGRLVETKGIQYLLLALSSILQEFPKTKVIIAGEGRYRRKLERLAASLHVKDAVQFLGFIDDQIALYSQVDCLVHPSTYDSMPLAILEAAAYGIPIVATCIGGIPEIIRHEKTGLLVPPRDPAAISSAVLRLFRDRNWGQKLGVQASRHVKAHFSIASITDQILNRMLLPELPPQIISSLSER